MKVSFVVGRNATDAVRVTCTADVPAELLEQDDEELHEHLLDLFFRRECTELDIDWWDNDFDEQWIEEVGVSDGGD